MERVCECGVHEGQLHAEGCRWELCPFCEEPGAANCDCQYDLLGLRSRANPPAQAGLATEVYERGLSPAQEAAWRTILEARGRLPYVDAPQLCGRCGALWPDMFMVQDAAWDYYAGPRLREAMLCEPCFRELRAAIDRHLPRPDWLPSDEAIDAYIRAWHSNDRAALRRLDPAKFEPGYQRPQMPRLASGR